MPDVIARAALQGRLEQVALRQGDRWPFCPRKYLGRFCPPAAGAAGPEAGEEETAAPLEAMPEEAFEPDPGKWPEPEKAAEAKVLAQSRDRLVRVGARP